MIEIITCLCGGTYQVDTEGKYHDQPHQCQACDSAKIEKNHREAISKAEALVAKKTPDRYLATDTTHPDFNVKLWERVATWEPTQERPWLGLTGSTGKSKTRCAYIMLREIAIGMTLPANNSGTKFSIPSVAVTSAYTIAEAVLAQFSDSKDSAVSFLYDLRTADILLIDDLGKQRNTPAISSELFALLDHRHAENLVTIWTANTNPEGIVNGMTEDLAGPLAGRIRECSTIINCG